MYRDTILDLVWNERLPDDVTERRVLAINEQNGNILLLIII